jgi:hypothetical protein
MGISFSSAQNGVGKSIGSEAQPRAAEALADHSVVAGHDFNFKRGNEHKIEPK